MTKNQSFSHSGKKLRLDMSFLITVLWLNPDPAFQVNLDPDPDPGL
jgi:hypothetical protein